MSQEVTNLTITVDTATKRGTVSGDRLMIRDTAIELTLVNITQADIDAGLVFTIYLGTVEFATCSAWTVNGDGDAVGALNTNTVNFVTFFANAQESSRKWFYYKIYATNSQVPLCSDRLVVENFTGNVDGTPTAIASPTEVLAAMQLEIDAATDAVAGFVVTLANMQITLDNAVLSLGNQITSDIQAHNDSATAHTATRDRITVLEGKLNLSGVSLINVTTATLKQTKEYINALVTILKG